MTINQNKLNLIKLDMEATEKMLSLLPAVREVLKKFDGKEATKRLDTALKAVDADLKFYKEFNSFIIEMYITKRCVKEASFEFGTVYIKDSYKTLVHISLKSSSGDGATQNGVLNAEEVIKIMNIQAACKNVNLLQTKHNLKNLEKLQAKKEKLQKQINGYNDSISYTSALYLDLKIKN